MHTPNHLVYFYKHSIDATTTGLLAHKQFLLNRSREPVGLISSNLIRSEIASTIAEYTFLPYTVNKKIITSKGILSISYTVVNKNAADCKIVDQSGEFANVKKVTRHILSNTTDKMVFGKFILEMDM